MLKIDEASYCESALETRQLTTARVALAAMGCAAFTSVLGIRSTCLWLTVLAAGELWVWMSTAPPAATWSLARRTNRIASSLFTSTVWASMGAMLWLHDDGIIQVAGAAIWASILIYVASSTYRNPLLGAATATPSVIAMLAFPMLFHAHHGMIEVGCVEFTLVLCIVHAASAAVRSYQTHHQIIAEKEKALAASTAKSAFLAMMSHEIRTPLNGVLGMAQAMAAAELEPVQKERLDIIRSSGENLLAILNDILDLAKIEAGKLELEQVEFDMAGLAEAVQAAFSAVAKTKGLQLELALDQAARGVYLGDATRVRQILYNLVSNALKFSERGAVRITIALCSEGVEFVVADSGVGIPAGRLPMLFQKFEQADASTTRRYGGTGLGLAICRELTDVFGGSIRAESVEGVGSRFFVVLPLQRLGDECAPASELSVAEVQDFGGFQVLAAEDNRVNQLVLKTLLNQAGIDPFIVSDGAEAVAAWRERQWDLILMDVQMPVMDGPTASQTIRALELASGRKRTPIIALTANAMAHQVKDYVKSGMDGFVAKPIEVGRLFTAIDLALAQDEPGHPQAIGGSHPRRQ